MPLINLQTDLKSFKYGHDRPGGGDSGQPFITTNIETGLVSANVASRNILGLFGINQIPGIPNVGSLISRNRIGRAVNDILNGDEFIRGGAVGAAQAALNDTLRIGLFLTSVPKGPIFIAQQVGLQLSNPKLEVKKGLRGAASGIFSPGGLLGTLTGGVLGPTRIYNAGINTVAQVPVNAFGGHFNRHGILPTQDENTKYEAVVKFNNDSPNSRQNRLIELTDKFNLGEGQINENPGIFNISEAKRQVRKENKANRRLYRESKRTPPLENVNLSQASQEFNRYSQTQFGTQVPPSQFQTLNLSGASKNFQSFGTTVPGNPSFRSQPTFPGVGTSAISQGTRSYAQNQFGGAVNNKLKKPKRLRLDTTKNTINSYIGGPGSVYGIGLTIINRYEFTEDIDRYASALTEANNNAGNGLIENGQRQSPTYNEIILNDIGDGTQYSIGEYKDDAISDYSGVPTDPLEIAKGINLGVVGTYADLVNKVNYQQQLIPYSYTKGGFAEVNRNVNEVGVQNDIQGVSGFSTTDIGKITYQNTYGNTVVVNKSNWSEASRPIRVGSGRTDSINLTPLFKTNTGEDYSVVKIKNPTTGLLETFTINDLVKFRIEAIDTDNPSKSVFMIFRAYLTDLSDDVTAEWTDVKYAGRGEKFYIYNGFNRKINISFKVAALSAKEMEPMYQKLNYLMSNLMPDYSTATSVNTSVGKVNVGGGLMRGPFVRMTVGNWIDSQPGIINSLSYKVPQDSPWEIALNEITNTQGLNLPPEMVLPHIVEVNLSFTPVGSQTKNINETPRKVKNNDVSNIAQNYNGANPKEPNYINGQLVAASGSANFEGGGSPSNPY